MRPQNKWVKVWFIRRPGKAASFRRFATQRLWDHAALELDTFICDVDERAGVMFRNHVAFEEMYPDRTLTVVRVQRPDVMERFLKEQLSKPLYDHPQSMHDALATCERWNPATLVAVALDIGGASIAWSDRLMTPSLLWSHMPLLVMSPTST